jgi:hypothetical protein
MTEEENFQQHHEIGVGFAVLVCRSCAWQVAEMDSDLHRHGLYHRGCST